MDRPNRFIYTGLFIISCSLLISEILLTRVFSVCLWYHFAFFVISIAMFGMGLGGICVQLMPKWFKIDKMSVQLFTCALNLAFSISITPLLLFKVHISPGIFFVFSSKTTLFLSIAFLLSSLPFFFGGIITSLLFRNYSIHISKLYFADLVGASLGCFLTIPLIEIFGASTAVLINACFACLGASCFLFGNSSKLDIVLFKRLCLSLVFFIGLTILNITTSIFDVRYAKGNDRSGDEFSKWNSISRISVSKILSNELARWNAEDIWGVSRNFKDKYPVIRMIQIDADAGTLLTQFNNDFNSVRYVRYDPPSIVHRLKSAPKTLIIGAGGGKDVLAALSFGAKHVTAVELNPIIVNDVMLGKYRGFTGGLYLLPKVDAVAEEGRSFITSSKDKYDIIQLAYVDTSAATSGGAYVLAENNLYTTESFKQFLNHLQADGIFSVCWVDVPGLAGSTRLISVGITTLEELGIEDVGKNIMVVTYTPRPFWTIQDILLKLTPFNRQEQEIVLTACKELGFTPMYIPIRDHSNITISGIKKYKDFVNALINDKEERNFLFYIFPFNIRPTTDDNPFFFYQSHPEDFFKTLKINQAASYIVYTSSTVVLIRVLFIGFIMVALFYILPLTYSAWNRTTLPYRKSCLVQFLFYFSSIGMGFMLLEIVFLQKLLLFLGHPAYTLSVALLSILFFAGLGSLFTQRLTAQPPHIYIGRVITSLLLVCILYLLYLHQLFQFFMGDAKGIKIFLAIIVLMPVAFLMGMPLPLAIKILQTRMNQVIPWMWGVNGATSVLASIIAIILAMNVGYNFIFILGCLCYVIAFFVGKTCFCQEESGQIK